uniref:Uncharacterized protein n=1 Tax=Homalodisca liturata TaxID=320908 RepID=A0A1B6JHM8_9HEMI
MFQNVVRAVRATFAPQVIRQAHVQKTTATVGSCGIPPFEDPTKKVRQKIMAQKGQGKFKLPPHLIRPPCLPGSEPGEEQTCLLDSAGLFCPVDRLKYKYPSFSENLKAIQGDGKVCWWFRNRECNVAQNDQMFTEKPNIS